MIDPLAKMRSLILAQSTLAALVSNRVYCEALPPGWQTGKQECLQAITMELDASELGTQALSTLNFNLYCWGESSVNAMAVARSVVDELHGVSCVTADGTRWNSILVMQFGPSNVLDPLGWQFVQVNLQARVAVG